MMRAELLVWLEQYLDDGCTDTTIFRGNGFWQIKFRHAGIPQSDSLALETFEGQTLVDALRLACEKQRERAHAPRGAA
jgi:hypothetical protein